jgi:hypothetical protein
MKKNLIPLCILSLLHCSIQAEIPAALEKAVRRAYLSAEHAVIQTFIHNGLPDTQPSELYQLLKQEKTNLQKTREQLTFIYDHYKTALYALPLTALLLWRATQLPLEVESSVQLNSANGIRLSFFNVNKVLQTALFGSLFFIESVFWMIGYSDTENVGIKNIDNLLALLTTKYPAASML